MKNYQTNEHIFRYRYSVHLVQIIGQLGINSMTIIYYLCDFVVRDITIAVYLQSSRKINFNLVSDFFSM